MTSVQDYQDYLDSKDPFTILGLTEMMDII